MPNNIDDTLTRLSHVRATGRKATAACPLHPENGAQLTIRREFGQIELECKKHCPDHEIVKALGLSMIDLMGDDDDDDLPAIDPGPEDEIDGEEETPAEDTIWPPPAPDTWGTERTNAFDAMPAREWLRTSRNRPMPKQLFGPFWMEGELSILFADTGKGKSVLAVQIAEALASGCGLVPFEPEIPARKVLYFDFELSEKMFEARYSVPSKHGARSDHYPFDENFIRAQLNGDPEFPDYFENWGEYLGHSFDELLKDSGARLMIIDNITFLGTASKERSGGAIRAMRVLHRFRREYGLSILVIAHTPKRLIKSALTVNDLQGSKMLSNFADNVFAIGESCLGEDVRYLKHIKPRNSPLIHGASKVCTYRIEKKSNFLCFKFTGFAHEREHLETLTLNNDTERRLLIKKVKEMAALGVSIRRIAAELGISRTTVTRFLRSLD